MSRMSRCIIAVGLCCSFARPLLADDLPPIPATVAGEAEFLIEELIGKDGVSGSLNEVFTDMAEADEVNQDGDIDSARAGLLWEIDNVNQNISAQDGRLQLLQRLVVELQSKTLDPTRQDLFALSVLHSEANYSFDESHIVTLKSWINSLSAFESKLDQLNRLRIHTSNPNVNLAIARYQPKLDAWNARKKSYLDDIDTIEMEVRDGFASLQKQIVGCLGAIAQTGQGESRVFASHSILRLAVYDGAMDASEMFLQLAAAETAIADPVFLNSLENVHLLQSYELDSDKKSSEFDKVDNIASSIVAGQPQCLANQIRFTKWVRERLVLDSFNSMGRDDTDKQKKFEARYLFLSDLLKTMVTRFDTSLKQELADAQADLFRIRFIGSIQ